MTPQKELRDEEILGDIIKIIAKIAMMEPEEISSSASLVDDLGFESIDFIDVAFQIEETFGIPIPRRNPIQRAADEIGRDQLVQEGKLTQKGAKLLSMVFPEVDPSRVYAGMAERAISSLITPLSYVSLVKRGFRLVHWKPERCNKCGSEKYSPADMDNLEFPEEAPLGPVFVCDSCKNLIVAPSFDAELYEKLSQG